MSFHKWPILLGRHKQEHTNRYTNDNKSVEWTERNVTVTVQLVCALTLLICHHHHHTSDDSGFTHTCQAHMIHTYLPSSHDSHILAQLT